jgi:hypothetical protein
MKVGALGQKRWINAAHHADWFVATENETASAKMIRKVEHAPWSVSKYLQYGSLEELQLQVLGSNHFAALVTQVAEAVAGYASTSPYQDFENLVPLVHHSHPPLTKRMTSSTSSPSPHLLFLPSDVLIEKTGVGGTAEMGLSKVRSPTVILAFASHLQSTRPNQPSKSASANEANELDLNRPCL